MLDIIRQILVDLFVGVVLLLIDHRYFLDNNDNKKK